MKRNNKKDFKGRTFRHRAKSQSVQTFAPTLNNDPCIITLAKTLKLNGWNNETRLQLRDFPNTGRGLCSKIHLKMDDTLIKVPMKTMISSCTLSKEDFEYIDQSKCVKLPIQTLLALFLCYETHKSSKSSWKFYLDSLPSCNPLTWLQLTPGEHVHFPEQISSRMHSFRTRFECSWDAAVAAINPTRKCRCCKSTFIHRVITRDLFAWSYAMINTRAVYIDPTYTRRNSTIEVLNLILDEPNLALCPFLDMFNHSTEAKTTPEILTHNTGDYYALRSHRNHRKYEQLFISYGAHDNAKLFVEYGFFIPGNAFDVWPINFTDVCKHFNLDSKVYKYLLSKGFDKDLYVSCAGELSYNLKAALFITSIHFKDDVRRIYCDDYTTEEIDSFRRFVARLMDVQLTLLTPKCFSDTMTHFFHKYLINFPIMVINKLDDLRFGVDAT